MHLATALELAAERHPDREVVVTPGRRLSFHALDAQANALAHGLRNAGISTGDAVAICASDPVVFAVSYFGVFKAGAVAVPLNTRHKADELRFALEDTRARAMIFDDAATPQARAALAGVDRDMATFGPSGAGACFEAVTQVPAGAPPLPPEARRADTAGTILYTSGTSGIPKGAVRSHRADYYAALGMIVAHRWAPGERFLGVMPFYHTMGLHTLISAVLLNGAWVTPGTFDPPQCLACMAAEGISALYLVPTAFYDLCRAAGRHGGSALPRGMKLAYAGAPMSPALVEACYECFRPAVFLNHYGCTEMHLITVNPDLRRKPTSAGRPGLHSRIRVVRADREPVVGPAAEVRPGEVGEVIADASLPQAFSGYLNRPEATARALREGWYFTGDLGYLDGEGDLHLVGRVDDRIISGGENIDPVEVEQVLSDHPLVRDVAVVGGPDERWGEQVTAFVVPASPALTAEALDTFCLESTQLARYKRPRRYIFVETIPRTPSGKVLRAALRHSLREA